MGAFNAFFFDHGGKGVKPLARFLRVKVRQGIRHEKGTPKGAGTAATGF
jgi:hypothetical protein